MTDYQDLVLAGYGATVTDLNPRTGYPTDIGRGEPSNLGASVLTALRKVEQQTTDNSGRPA